MYVSHSIVEGEINENIPLNELQKWRNINILKCQLQFIYGISKFVYRSHT